jgi:hypothetical protein
MGGAIPPLPNTPSWRGAQLGGAQGQLYLFLRFIGYTAFSGRMIVNDKPGRMWREGATT